MVAEMQGGTFTISNGGVWLAGCPRTELTAVGHPRMPAIQGPSDGRRRRIVIRPMMYLALSYDHRVVDGKVVTFSQGKRR
jgi:2-oxoglutarate dehydrogenase E2 component (dihydrolipoamide succinyltransferase)